MKLAIRIAIGLIFIAFGFLVVQYTWMRIASGQTFFSWAPTGFFSLASIIAGIGILIGVDLRKVFESLF